MTEQQYTKLSRQQKLAVFLIIIGPEAAAEILRQFDDEDVETLCRHMSAFPMIPAEVQAAAMHEFAGIVAHSADAALGGLPYAQHTVELAKGNGRAAAILGRVGPVPGTSTDTITEIGGMDARHIYNLVKYEQPQTISFLLSYLSHAKASEVFALLGPEVRDDVLERLGTIESTSPELVGKIARRLGRYAESKPAPAFRASGGARAVADLLKGLDKDTSKNLLGRLEAKNQQLTAAVRRKLFGFEDLIRLQVTDLQRVLREVDSAVLARAMKPAPESLREYIFAAMSKRAVESLREEMEMMTVKLKEAEAAQDAIIVIVRRLEDEGQIVLEAEGAESVVA